MTPSISRRVALASARAYFVLLASLTSFYCVLAYVSFTYEQFIAVPVLPMQEEFVLLHPWLWLIAVLALVLVTSEHRREPKAAAPAIAFLGVMALTACGLFARPVLATLVNDTWSLVWALIAFVPVLGLGIVDTIACVNRVRWGASKPADRLAWRWFVACAGAAVSVAALHFVRAFAVAPAGRLSDLEWGFTFAWSMLSHTVIFAGIYLALMSVHGLSSFASRSRVLVEALMSTALLGAVIAVFVHDVLLASISVTGISSAIYSATVGLALAVAALGSGLRACASRGTTIDSGPVALAQWLMPAVALRRGALGALVRAVTLAALVAPALLVPALIGSLDWNRVAQQMAAVLVWGGALGWFLIVEAQRPLRTPRPAAAQRPGPPTAGTRVARSAAVMVLAPLTLLTAFRTLEERPVWRITNGGTAAAPRYASVLRHYEGWDASMTVARRVLSPPAVDPGFYAMLQRNSNIPHAVTIRPVDIELARSTRSSTETPDIYLFVIDSLRPDYVGAYNRAVDFTPSIDSFARDAIVFERAFTRYGATGLAVPALWVGGMIPHQQYPKPFYPMNSLSKLLQRTKYRLHMSPDNILRRIVPGDGDIAPLEVGVAGRNLRLCREIEEIMPRLAQQRPGSGPPVFGYFPPMDIHISVIRRERRSVLDDADYGDFYAPYASRVRAFDRCFGEFVDFLKDQGRYEESIIIVTSDHGDSLGEDGRWGHGHTVYPEVLRIPLIVHLPERFHSRLSWEPQALAFLTDITPSLYYLLGYKELQTDDLFGSPLFYDSPEELAERLQRTAASNYLVSSSYGPVFGILSGAGDKLFIADGVHFTDELWELTTGAAGTPLPLSEDDRARYRASIARQIAALNRFYGIRLDALAAGR